MIERNLGNIERIIRLILGVTFLTWSVTRPSLNGVDWFVMLIATALILNGIFSRCYLWFILDLSSHESANNRERGETTC